MGWSPFRRKSAFQTAFTEAARRAGFEVARCDDKGARLTLHQETCDVSFSTVRRSVEAADRAQWGAMLDRFVVAIRDGVVAKAAGRASLEQVRANLMPRVGLPSEVDAERAPHREVAGGLLQVHLVIEAPGNVRPVRGQDLDQWSASFEDVESAALENLAQTSHVDKLVPLSGTHGTFVYDTRDAYDATRMLLVRELLQPWPPEGVVVLVPTRDVLLCVPLRGSDALTALQATIVLAQGLHARAASPLTDQPLWFDGEVWERVATVRTGQSISIAPSERFVKVVERLSSSRGLLD